MVYIFYTHAQKKEGFYRMQLDHDLYVADSLFTVPKKKRRGRLQSKSNLYAFKFCVKMHNLYLPQI